MAKEAQHTETISAADTSIGFDFQYYYFLWRLLNLKSGETVGLEVLDDVHTELANSRQILVQLKHTVQTNADGSAKNLTTLDSDLWKSLSNWSLIVADQNAGRDTVEKQVAFAEKTDFILVSNKSENESNTILTDIGKYQQGVTTHEDLLKSIEALKAKTTDTSIKDYIKNVLALSSQVSQVFFRNLSFDLGCDDIIAKCKTAIREHMIDESKIEEVFSGLDSKLRSENYFAVKNKQKIVISFEDMRLKFRAYFDRARNGKLYIIRFTGELPDKLENQNFIRQLTDIGDIPASDTESMAEFTRHLLQMQNNIDEWYKNGDITRQEVDAFNTEAKTRWHNEYRKCYRGNFTEAQIAEKALNLLDKMRGELLMLSDQQMPTDMSNGQFYHLSDLPEIGWHKDWEGKYKG